MTDRTFADTPISIDRVDRVRGNGDGVGLRLRGRWLQAGQAEEQEPLLVIQLQGRRHRFPPSRDEPPAAPVPPGGWEATFMVPAWAEPSLDGQAALWVGNSVVAVPLPGSAAPAPTPVQTIPSLPPQSVPMIAVPAESVPMTAAPAESVPMIAARPPDSVRSLGDRPELALDPGGPGAPPDLLFKESVAALHTELEQRSAETARLRGALADARSELDARTATQAALESAHADLRAELQELMTAVGVQREDVDWRLTDAEDRLAAAASERDSLRANLESERASVRRELEAERGRAAQQLADMTGARDAAAGEAAALSERLTAIASTRQRHAEELITLREQLAAAQVSRDALVGEVTGLRAELDRLGSELAVAREQMSSQGGDLGEAQQLLADARALTEQLRGQTSH